MNPRTLHVLEYPKILERIAARCAFSGGQELARALLPSDDLPTVQQRLQQTAEAVRLLEQKTDISFGGVRDIRPAADKAARRALLLAPELLEVRQTLLRARQLRTLLTRVESGFPHLAELAAQIEPCDEVVNEIGRAVNERGDVVDSASPALLRIRAELRAAQERLLSTLERLVHNPDLKPYLQDALVTQRQGRYVIPVRAEHKGSIEGIVHDQSASGATLFVEPLKVVQQNNAVREWELEEEREVRRILTELTELVADEAVYIRRNVEILAELDFVFARARYALDTDSTLPEVSGFRRVKQPLRARGAPAGGGTDSSITGNGDAPADDVARTRTGEPIMHPGSILDLQRARHPLLDPATVVPIDVYLDDETYIVVVTGPNTGGKTVALKTIGLMALMAQSGLLLPCDPGSRLSVFEGIYADIGDEQSIEQSLSTFSGHLTNIIEILDEADPHTLVLLDELGAGTDPDEGSALAMALLENLRDRGVTTFATTHYSDLKLYAHSTPGVVNASVEFDIETLSPTFELSIGLPGRSNALTIARRLGLNPTIVDRAEGMVRPDQLHADRLLEDIKRARQEASLAADRAKARERQAQLVESDLRYQLASIEEARRTVIAETRALMERELDELRREIEQTRRQLRSTPFASGQGTHDEFLARAEQEIARRNQPESEIERKVVVPGRSEERVAGAIEVGDRVFVASLQASGEVLAIYERDAEADVQLGSFRLRLPLKRLELRQKAVKDEPAPRITLQGGSAAAESPGLELDLRGARVDEGLDRLERYLNQAYRARLPFVRIIHGRGTGAMRNAVREVLGSHPLVGSSRPGENNEGGDGVTVVKLVQS